MVALAVVFCGIFVLSATGIKCVKCESETQGHCSSTATNQTTIICNSECKTQTVYCITNLQPLTQTFLKEYYTCKSTTLDGAIAELENQHKNSCVGFNVTTHVCSGTDKDFCTTGGKGNSNDGNDPNKHSISINPNIKTIILLLISCLIFKFIL